jgi:fructose-1,6-bisphosphatase I
MDERVTLRSHLDRSASQTPYGAALGDVIKAIAGAATELAELIADGPLAGMTGQDGDVNSDGDRQKDIDIAADAVIRRALRDTAVAAVLSEEAVLPETLRPTAPFCVAIDPLDGSANLKNNISVGTIFSVRPRGNDVLSTFFEPGTAQCAAGFIVYGPQTMLVLALNARVDIFILDRRARGGTGTARCAPISTNASPAPTAVARRTSTCAGSARWLRNRFASWCAAACSSIRPMRARAIARAGFVCCTRPIRWRW